MITSTAVWIICYSSCRSLWATRMRTCWGIGRLLGGYCSLWQSWDDYRWGLYIANGGYAYRNCLNRQRWTYCWFRRGLILRGSSRLTLHNHVSRIVRPRRRCILYRSSWQRTCWYRVASWCSNFLNLDGHLTWWWWRRHNRRRSSARYRGNIVTRCRAPTEHNYSPATSRNLRNYLDRNLLKY